MTPKPDNILCPTSVPPELEFGEYANAIRVITNGEEDCFIDFCLYSPRSKKAKVVSRVRIDRTFLPIILGTFQRIVRPQPDQVHAAKSPLEEAEFIDGQLRSPDGRILVLGPGSSEEN